MARIKLAFSNSKLKYSTRKLLVFCHPSPIKDKIADWQHGSSICERKERGDMEHPSWFSPVGPKDTKTIIFFKAVIES